MATMVRGTVASARRLMVSQRKGGMDKPLVVMASKKLKKEEVLLFLKGFSLIGVWFGHMHRAVLLQYRWKESFPSGQKNIAGGKPSSPKRARIKGYPKKAVLPKAAPIARLTLVSSFKCRTREDRK